MKKTKINIDTLERKFAYNAFLNHDNPFTSIVCNMDITNLVKHTKENGNFYDWIYVLFGNEGYEPS